VPGSRHFDRADLTELIEECCRGAGLSSGDAEAVADALVYASLRGQDAHGFARLANYMRRLYQGLARGSEDVRVAAEHGVVRRIDARRAIGPAVARRATDMAIDVAERDGAAVVAVGDTTHFGAAGFYARRIAERGLVALVLSNGPRAVAPHGAAQALLGTNPLAIGLPAGAGAPVVLDFATAAIARGQVRRAAASAEPLPPGVALDDTGRPTTDADAALTGSLLPFGGAKGSGLAFAIAMLAALLAGAQLDDEMGPMQPGTGSFPLFDGSVGHVFVAIDPRPLTGDAGQGRAADFADRLRKLDPAAGFATVQAPGDRGDATAAARARDGIPVPLAHLAEVADACRQAGLDELAVRVEGGAAT
jgi:LDH2 family malate/lactate/ureidoglycolate dehydrogenase